MKERFNVQSNKEEEMWPPKTDSLTDGLVFMFHSQYASRCENDRK